MPAVVFSPIPPVLGQLCGQPGAAEDELPGLLARLAEVPDPRINGEIPPDADTLDNLADESVDRLRQVAESVVVAHRREAAPLTRPP